MTPLIAAAMSTASTASAQVAEVLRQPDDLVKLAAFRKKLLKEKATLDAKLAAGVKAQLEATRDALLKLQASRAAVSLIREEMMALEKLKGDEEAGEAFDKITRVSGRECQSQSSARSYPGTSIRPQCHPAPPFVYTFLLITLLTYLIPAELWPSGAPAATSNLVRVCAFDFMSLKAFS